MDPLQLPPGREEHRPHRPEEGESPQHPRQDVLRDAEVRHEVEGLVDEADPGPDPFEGRGPRVLGADHRL